MDDLFVTQSARVNNIQENEVKESPLHLRILERDLVIKRSCGRVAIFTFEDLCSKVYLLSSSTGSDLMYLQPVGAIDFLELCEHFDVIILTDIPQMNIFKKTQARRFITLIDTLYDNKVK